MKEKRIASYRVSKSEWKYVLAFPEHPISVDISPDDYLEFVKGDGQLRYCVLFFEVLKCIDQFCVNSSWEFTHDFTIEM